MSISPALPGRSFPKSEFEDHPTKLGEAELCKKPFPRQWLFDQISGGDGFLALRVLLDDVLFWVVRTHQLRSCYLTATKTQTDADRYVSATGF